MVFLIAGIIAADIYAMLLWLSVKNLREAKNPVLLVVGGFAGRMALAAAVFVLAAYGWHADRLIACVAGFVIMRTLSVNAVKRGSAVKNEH